MELIAVIILALVVIGVVGFIIAVMALIEVKALKNSTHKIEWMPAPKPSFNDNPLPTEDNESEADETEDDLFADDIDLFLDPRPRRGKA